MSERIKLPNDYFPHDFNARSDRKILRLRKVLGCEGYGIFWMLVETLAVQPNFSYPFSDVDLLADEFGTSTAKVEAVIKQFDLFEIDKGAHFFSLSLIVRLQKYLEISQKARENVNKRWKKVRELKSKDQKQLTKQYDRNTTVLPPHNDRNTIKEKNIKEDKRKEDKTRQDSLGKGLIKLKKPLGLQEVLKYAYQKEYDAKMTEKFYKYNCERNWLINDKPIVNWQKLLDNWNERELNKCKIEEEDYRQGGWTDEN